MDQIAHSLAALRRYFGGDAARQKLRLLAAAGAKPPRRARALRTYHDELLYLHAYPDNRAVLRAAESELRRLARAVKTFANRTAKKPGRSLQNTGIVHTDIADSFSIDLLRWLADRFGAAVELDWRNGSAGAELEEFLPALLATVEADGLLTEELSTREWFGRAQGSARRTDLAWLLAQFDRLACAPAVLDHIFGALHLSVRWRLTPRSASRTFTRFPPRPAFFHAASLQRHATPAEWVRVPLPAPQRLSARAAQQLIDTARATLAVRNRETDPVTYANPRETTLFRLERGIDVALFGLSPERRLPIETYIGFVAAKNRVPVAYGGGWVFFDRCEIGVNLFEEFRGGESALLFSQVLRVYQRHFRARQFLVAPYQFGAGNTEAIRSGAFWFYYRLGFRPTDAKLRRLADEEHARIHARPGHRTPARILRRLAGSKIYWNVEEHLTPDSYMPVAPDLIDLSLAVTTWIGKRFDGDRTAAEKWAVARVRRALGASNPARWPPHQRAWFERLSLLAALLPDLTKWPIADKRALLTLLRAKGGPRERAYALRLQRHARLRGALEPIARNIQSGFKKGLSPQ